MSINIAPEIVHFAGHAACPPAPAAVPIAPRGLSGIGSRPVQRVQRLGVCRVLHGLPWYLSALVLARPALLPVLLSLSGCAGLGSPPLGYMGRAGGGVVDASRRKNSKKAFFLPTPSFLRKTPYPLLPISKISRKNKKTPTKGLCSVLYLPYKP